MSYRPRVSALAVRPRILPAVLCLVACAEDVPAGDAGLAFLDARVEERGDLGVSELDAGFDDAEAVDHGPVHEEPVPSPVPDTMLGNVRWQDRVCEVAGLEIPLAGVEAVDDCIICQCTRWGGRCSRREGCTRPVCVLVDGQVAPRGEARRVLGCFVCTCGAEGPRCERDVEAPCPAEGCHAPYLGEPPFVVIPFGANRFVSECHRCACDELLGTSCEDVCHSECLLPDESIVLDQVRFPDPSGCGSCVCDYGEISYDHRGCED